MPRLHTCWFAALFLFLCQCSTNGDEPPITVGPLDVGHATIEIGLVHDVAWADFDMDGDGDLLFVAGEAPALRMFSNDGGNGFSEAAADPFVAVELGGSPRLAVADVDRDRDPDIVVCASEGTAGLCTLLLNQYSERGAVTFVDGSKALGERETPFSALPLLADHDRDGDVDLLLFARDGRQPLRLLRNKPQGTSAVFSLVESDEPAVVVGPARHVAELVAGLDPDLGRPIHTLYVSNDGEPDQLLDLEDTTLTYDDVTAARFGGTPRVGAPTIAVGDFNEDKKPDLLLHELARWSVHLQDDAGAFVDRTSEVLGLPDLSFASAALLAEDFDRDGRMDVFVAGDASNDHVLLLQRPEQAPEAGADVQLRFVDATSAAVVGEKQEVAGAKTFLRARDCDHSVELVIAGAGSVTRLHLFADDSDGKTISASQSLSMPVVENGCVRGSDGDDELIGHRVASVLSGGSGNDKLRARAGYTVMSGGPGVDLFEARGTTLVLLPEGDIAAGDTIDCSKADFVYVDSPRTPRELRAAGVEFIDCVPDEECAADFHDARLRRTAKHHVDEAPDEIADCHEQPHRLDVFNAGLQPNAQAIEFGDGLNLVGNSGSGFGDCRSSADCYAIGLDVCRTANGSPTQGVRSGKCYPSGFQGFEGPIADWCNDPFWARYRYDEIQSLGESDDRKLVIPVTFWLIRSEAATDGGGCSAIPRPTPKSIAEWHESLVETMNTGFAYFSRWGITFDYQFRVFEVPDDSPYVVDPDDDQCRTELTPGDADPNSVGAFVDEYQLDVFIPGEFNVYMKDAGGPSWSSTAMVNNGTQKIEFLILSGSAGAFVHEMGHGVGLPHPYSNNLSASGVLPDKAESRDSWLARAFPDEDFDRINLCDTDSDCNGVDAPAGICRKAPDASRGFCQNLKKDCAEDGDQVCDTPWDAFPCFRHVSNNEGEECTNHDDCQGDSSTRGRAYLTRCGGSGFCVKASCSQNSDCGGGSWCADGTCIIWKEGTDACCHLSTDLRSAFDHNVCYEKRPNGNVVNVPGVGASTTWPIHDNAMTYHKPVGRKRTFTNGQRDQAVCETSYRKDFGALLRKPLDHTDVNQPCSMRPGAIAFDYGDVGETRKIAHGACASGVCQLTKVPSGTLAFCTDSTCTDGVKGEGETSVDCGGICPDKCPTERKDGPGSSQCVNNGDCESGFCHMGTCQATCEDGIQNGSEVDVDSGGSSFDASCSLQSTGDLCRYDDDCLSGAGCEGEGTCILSADCPVNDEQVACEDANDCPGGLDCVVLQRQCASSGCFEDSECPSGACQLPAGRCSCETSFDCFTPSDACLPVRSFCKDQCIDGRCRGECGIVISG